MEEAVPNPNILVSKFRVTFFAFCAPFFAFCISHHGRHSHEKSKDFVVYFFAALIKHEICMKYKKCIVNVSYFVVCFAKTFTKWEIWKVYSRPKRYLKPFRRTSLIIDWIEYVCVSPCTHSSGNLKIAKNWLWLFSQ